MKKYKLKLKLLVYGFPLTEAPFIMDGFELKYEKIDIRSISEEISKNPFTPSGYIYNCVYKLQNDENTYYNYFENVGYLEYSISNNKSKNKKSILHHFSTSNDIEELINNFKKKLRLIYNLRIIFPICKIEIYDENEKFIGYFINYNDFPSKLGLINDLEKETFYKNSRTGFNLERFLSTEKNNIKFGRAMSLFNDSFESSDVSIRFLLLFSCLESLFITSKKDITENLALCTSRIFFYDNIKDEEKMYEKVKKLYDYRCKFIHGQKLKNITNALEKELREIVRYVLLIYWNMCLSGKTSNQIIKALKNKEKVSLLIKMYAKIVMYDDYDKAYKENLEMIALEIAKGNVIITEEENGVIKSVKEL